ncbi:M48 family metalloprotease [Polyangium sorediatum]|uniref:M48 family metalloprotease n=1 Tax=Polyangium sorediatum TaxID=889274 RepID=A0ABT6NWB1_9BACT|nr:M48 family metalloprotease [Polyangium sorediatum]MDI1432608.1 M48 family metalloprotease [Polyangium sorediatum]
MRTTWGKRAWRFGGAWLVALAGLLTSGEGKAADEAAFERELAAQIQKLDPEAATLFAEANAARERNDLAGAAGLYEQVRARVPKFSAATRRLCTVKLHQGARNEAIALCRKALETEDVAENKAALAQALLMRPQGTAPNTLDVREAFELASSAAARKPDDKFAQLLHCESALQYSRFDQLRTCSRALERIAPEFAPTYLYASMVDASEGHLDKALEKLERGKSLGIDEATYTSLKGQYEEAMPFHERYGATMLYGFLGWLAGLVALLGLGGLLSKLTLRAATAVPKSADENATGADKWLRRIYGVVLWACCAYYYISLPIVMSLVLVAGGGIIYGFLAIGRIPVKLVAIVAIFTLVSLWAMLKSIFFRRKEGEPGDKLDLAEHPKLRAVLEEVAGRIGTRPVDNVYMTPTTEVGVFERGGLLRQLTGRTERCLVLGAGVLDGFSIGAFKAVLAHEYGHFHNEDTAGGGFALAVRRSVFTMALSLAQGGAAGWYNPAWLFVSGFHKIFLRISQGASRLQEVLADRWAAFAYGADAFTEGLKHVIERSIRFDVHTQVALSEVIQEKRALANLYRYRVRGKTPEDAEIEKAVDEAIHAEPSPYDSHPSPADRFAWVNALPKRTIESSPDDTLEVWALFGDRAKLEKQMTQKIREAVAMNHGVVIPAGKPKAKAKKDEAGEETDEAEEQAPEAAGAA